VEFSDPPTIGELKALRTYATMRAHAGQGDAVVTVLIHTGRGNPSEADFRAEIRPNASMSPCNLVITVIYL